MEKRYKPPKTIRILGRDYDVIVTKKPPKWAANAAYGAVNWITGVIWIERGRSAYSQASALFHEIFETILHYALVTEPRLDGNEEIVFTFNHAKFQDISNQLFATLRDNKVI